MEQGVEKVTQSEALAEQADEAIRTIQSSTSHVVGMVSDISNAILENSAASQDVAKTVENIAQLSEENSAAAKEVASTASHLNHLATDLNSLAGSFKTSHETRTNETLNQGSQRLAIQPSC
jgi:methyl-accepting chemotaxis protein